MSKCNNCGHETGQRTDSQNNALHLYLSNIAKELEKEGHTMQDVVKAIKTAEVIPTTLGLKEVVWKPIQRIMFDKTSTTELSKQGEIDRIYDVANKFFGENFHVYAPFPSKCESCHHLDCQCLEEMFNK